MEAERTMTEAERAKTERAKKAADYARRKKKRLIIKVSQMEREMKWKPSAHRAVIRNLTNGQCESMNELDLGQMIRLERAIAARLERYRAKAKK